jgi:hypothetical protein
LIDGVVAPLDHKYDVPADEVKVTEPPAQNVVGPPAVIVGAAGAEGAVNDPFNALETHPDALVNVIL